jgi:hypothetical protein
MLKHPYLHNGHRITLDFAFPYQDKTVYCYFLPPKSRLVRKKDGLVVVGNCNDENTLSGSFLCGLNEEFEVISD